MRFVSFGVIFCFLLFAASCVKDRCKDTACNNGGVCVDGNCSCLNGYEGEHCDEVWNERYLFNWEVDEVENLDTVHTHYLFTLLSTGAPDEFMIMNLHGSLDSIICKRTSYYTFSFIQRYVADSALYLKSGIGTMDSSGNAISAYYILQEGDTAVQYTTTWSKQ